MATENIPDTVTTSVPIIRMPVAWPEWELQNGDQMNREEFHRLYERTPEGFKAELIGGIVYVASPVSPSHGKPDQLLGAVFAAYEGDTLGVDGSHNTTVFMGPKDEPQPDQYLRILPEYGGQSSWNKDGYVEGAPEFIAEVAYSSRAIDLRAKKNRYRRCDVREYLVVSVKEQQFRWFDLAGGKELQADAAGIYRIHTFPGLWINGPALLAYDYASLMRTLEEGLATPEHAAFVKKLAATRDSGKQPRP